MTLECLHFRADPREEEEGAMCQWREAETLGLCYICAVVYPWRTELLSANYAVSVRVSLPGADECFFCFIGEEVSSAELASRS